MVFQDILSPEWPIDKLFISRYKMLIDINVAFQYIDKNMMEKIASMICPREYAAVVWSLNIKKDIRK